MLAIRERTRGKKHKHQLEFFVSWKGMGPENNQWLSVSELMIAIAVVQDYDCYSCPDRATPSHNVSQDESSYQIPNDQHRECHSPKTNTVASVTDIRHYNQFTILPIATNKK